MPEPKRPADVGKPEMTQLDEHFEFGANWQRFLELVDDSRIAAAVASLRSMLELPPADRSGHPPLDGCRFLDIGCGSGLFSLAAHRLGADVVSFDFDPQSAACTREMQRRFAHDTWPVHQGSVLDGDFLASLGLFDVVYSWGVLHHTGAMWAAIENAATCVDDAGRFAIALYNEQRVWSRVWTGIKRTHHRLPSAAKTPYVALVGAVYYTLKLPGAIGRRLLRVVQKTDPPRAGARGMNLWVDLVDWVGGWPFEVATPRQVTDFVEAQGFRTVAVETVGRRLGCNEFLFERVGSGSRPSESGTTHLNQTEGTVDE